MRKLLLVLGVWLAMLMASSCTTLSGGSITDEGSEPATISSAPQAAEFLYYDFDDVAIPQDLDQDKDASFVIETPPTKSGVLVFDGRVERLSLTDFFLKYMANDGWTLRSAFKAPRTILVFEKTGRFCVISITDKGRYYKTHVEIWVTSSTAGLSGGLSLPEIGSTRLQSPMKERGLSE